MEIAVVLFIVGLLMSSAMYTLSAQMEQRKFSETQRLLDEARELLIAFAIVNGRLPCPATTASAGDEAPVGGGACTSYLNGLLPATAIGFRPVDSSGFAVDGWGNRLRYAIARDAITPSGSPSCPTPATPGSFTTALSLKANGVNCAPLNIVICDASQNTNSGVSPPRCGTWATAGDARAVTNQRTVVAVVFSSGKNGSTGSVGADEIENTDNDGVFVYHEPRPAGAPGGEYDDMVAWLPASLLYNRLIGAGVLP